MPFATLPFPSLPFNRPALFSHSNSLHRLVPLPTFRLRLLHSYQATLLATANGSRLFATFIKPYDDLRPQLCLSPWPRSRHLRYGSIDTQILEYILSRLELPLQLQLPKHPPRPPSTFADRTPKFRDARLRPSTPRAPLSQTRNIHPSSSPDTRPEPQIRFECKLGETKSRHDPCHFRDSSVSSQHGFFIETTNTKCEPVSTFRRQVGGNSRILESTSSSSFLPRPPVAQIQVGRTQTKQEAASLRTRTRTREAATRSCRHPQITPSSPRPLQRPEARKPSIRRRGSSRFGCNHIKQIRWISERSRIDGSSTHIDDGRQRPNSSHSIKR